MKKYLLIIVLLVAVIGVTGCQTHNQTKLGPGTVDSVTTTASQAAIDVAGNQTANYQGLAPTLIKQDAEGNWVNMGGPTGIISAPVPGTDQLAYIISQSNTSIAEVSYTPVPADGEAQFVVKGIETNMSDPMALHVAALNIAVVELTKMTQQEALAAIEKWKTAGTVAEAFIPLLTQIAALL